MRTLAAFVIAVLVWVAIMAEPPSKEEQTIIYRYCGHQVPQECRDVMKEVK